MASRISLSLRRGCAVPSADIRTVLRLPGVRMWVLLARRQHAMI